tara:strand:- start:487 stop:897 length:411 start_codon:yes stop_codon:yes gene_type:complete
MAAGAFGFYEKIGKKMSKKEFVSKNNLKTHKVWKKELHGRWSKVIHHNAVLKEEFWSKGKNGEITVLTEGSQVTIDDIRGRINPQFRCKDAQDRIWFIPVGKLDVLGPDERFGEIDEKTHRYRGGVREKIGDNKNG